MVEKIKISLTEWEVMVDKLAKEISIHHDPRTPIFGVPRGGCLITARLATKLPYPIISEYQEGCVVVDDLIDSGKTRKKYANSPFFVLINKQKDAQYKGKWIEFWYEKTEDDAESIVTRQLEMIGENPNREGLVDTPKRVVKMWKEIFRGYDKTQKPKLTSFDNGKDGIVYDEMIIDSGEYYSHCEHHMVPFFGKYWFAYIPNKKIIGLSKVARMVDYYSAKLQIQERLVKEILDEIEREIKPKGIAMIMEGEHLCKTMRGARKKGTMITSDLRGVFKSKPDTRMEFLHFVRGR